MTTRVYGKRLLDRKLDSRFSHPSSGAMNLLNEVVLAYPSAISFAPGQPPEDLFALQSRLGAIADHVVSQAHIHQRSEEEEWNALGQYGRTKGLINEQIACQLRNDEDIRLDPEQIIVTTGAQEAMATLLIGLFRPGRDVLLASDPTYIGITALARILGIEVLPVPTDDRGIIPDGLESIITKVRKDKRIIALYDIPDFNNPLGTYLPLPRRLDLLRICRQSDILIFEDNPYGMFLYDGQKLPTLKALDQDGSVVYIGSYSKTVFPSLRIGFLALPNYDQIRLGSLNQLSKVKSLLTVNTCALSQALLGGLLLQNGNSLRDVVGPSVSRVHANRDILLKALSHSVSKLSDEISWSYPRGGFFLTVQLPWTFKADDMYKCAEKFGVIVCPMSLFSTHVDCEKAIRMSFSYIRGGSIDEGVAALTSFLKTKLR